MRTLLYQQPRPPKLPTAPILSVSTRSILPRLLILLACAGSADAASAASQPAHTCHEVTLKGEVSQGQQWSAEIGQGWQFRLEPIPPSGQAYSGWDLIVNPVGDGAYPDALLLATPPYGSLNQRELGTTFGLRAQDAIAWSPRRFHFLASIRDLARARDLFSQIMSSPTMSSQTMPSPITAAQTSPQKDPIQTNPSSVSQGRRAGIKPGQIDARLSAQSRLLALLSNPAAVGNGVFTVVDTRLVPGSADAPAFAEQWAANLSHVPHTTDQSAATTTLRGELHWVRFEVTLWLPQAWNPPPALRPVEAKCAE